MWVYVHNAPTHNVISMFISIIALLPVTEHVKCNACFVAVDACRRQIVENLLPPDQSDTFKTQVADLIELVKVHPDSALVMIQDNFSQGL